MNTDIDIGLARYSDWAFTGSVVILVLAMLLLAVELASSRSRRADARELVGAAAVGTTGGVDLADNRPGVVIEEAAAPFSERVGKAGLNLVYLGILLLGACIVLRGLSTHRAPWGNMYEFINLTGFCGLVAAAVVLRRPQYRALWVFVLVPVLVLLTISGKWLYTHAAPVMPAPVPAAAAHAPAAAHTHTPAQTHAHTQPAHTPPTHAAAASTAALPGKLVPLLRGLRPLGIACPVAHDVELALDDHHRMHIVGRADQLARVRTARHWAHVHRELLGMAFPDLRNGFEVRERLLLADAREAIPLHGTGVLLDLLVTAETPAGRVQVVVPLNDPSTAG